VEEQKMTKKTGFVTAYGDRVREQFHCDGESLTQQHFVKECDIKEIIKKHDRTGIIAHVNRGVAQYGDYSEVHEYREAIDLVNNAQESFEALPSDVRKLFDNDPGEFFEFATNPDNADRMVELGLAPSPAPAESGKAANAANKAPAESVDTEKSED
jgi:phage internal scaffolding protein